MVSDLVGLAVGTADLDLGLDSGKIGQMDSGLVVVVFVETGFVEVGTEAGPAVSLVDLDRLCDQRDRQNETDGPGRRFHPH